MHQRPIPSSGEMLPVVGLGTYRGFDQAPADPACAALPAVVDALFDAGGSVVDSSPMYGRAETSVGDILVTHARRSKCFLATSSLAAGWCDGSARV